jgi:hypothetical protein
MLNFSYPILLYQVEDVLGFSTMTTEVCDM